MITYVECEILSLIEFVSIFTPLGLFCPWMSCEFTGTYVEMAITPVINACSAHLQFLFPKGLTFLSDQDHPEPQSSGETQGAEG